MKVSPAKKPTRKTPPKKPVLVGDISPSGTTSKIINLKKKLPAIQIDMRQIKNWWFVHQHKFFIVISIIVGALVLSSFSTGHASIATFHPSSCLGDWEHAELAQGDPSLPEESNPEKFSLENSARMPGSVSSIYCGGFKGEIPENTNPTTFKLTLSWSVDDASVTHEVSQPFEMPQPEEVAPPKEEETTSEDVKPEEEVKNPEAEPAPEVVPTQTETVSFFKRLFTTKVMAQEAVPTEVATPVAETTTPVESKNETQPEVSTPVIETKTERVPEEQDILVVPENPLLDQESDTTALDTSLETGEVIESPEKVEVQEKAPDAFMEVQYTLDGTTWKSLGTISRSAWQRASFDIPIEAWENLDNLQVALKALPTFDAVPVVYLDAMTLSVEYSDMPDLVAPPTVLLNDSAALIDGKKDFNSTENITFSVTAPNLDIDGIKTLVDEGKATIIKDTQGVLGDKIADPNVTAKTKETVQVIKDTVQETKEKLEIPIIDVTPAPIPPDENAPVSFLKKIFSPQTAEAAESTIAAVVLDNKGLTTDIPATVVTETVEGVQTQHIEIDKPDRSFRPGSYTLVVTFTTPQAIIVSEQDFTWGVLVINTNKTVYNSGDDAYIQMGVLSDDGHTICNSDLNLTITNPNGIKTNLSTSNGGIIREAQCGPDNVITVPDYYAHFTGTDIAGAYTMVLTAQTSNGTKTIIDAFTVASGNPVSIERMGPSRIYPIALYPMTIKVTSPVDWQGVVTERVPDSFEISPPEQSVPYDAIESQTDTKIISWNVSLTAGQPLLLGYYFNAPDVSPEFYMLGKAKFVDTAGTTTFEETRNWQIASDAACNATGSGTWSATANFINCTGAASGGAGTGLRPGAADALTINSGVALVADTTATITSLAFAASTAATSVTINNGVTLTVSGVTTITSPGAAGTNTITVGGGTSGVLSTAGLSIPGSATAGRFSTLTLAAGGTLTTTSGITFSGTAAQSRLTNSSAATINLTGTMSAGGTVTVNSGTTMNTTGTAALNGAYTLGILNVNTGTTSMGGVAIIHAGLVTVASGATLNASSATGLKTFSAGVTVNTTTGIFDLKTGSNFATATSFGGNITANGTTFNSGTGAVTITGTGTLTIAGSSGISLGGTLTIPTNKTIVNSNTGTVTIGALTLASPTASNGLSLSTGSTTAVTGEIRYTANATANSQTITMNGTSNISAATLVINRPTTNGGSANITCAASATGTFSTSGAATINSASTATATVNVLMNTCNFSAGGLLTLAGGTTGGLLTFTTTTGVLTTSAGITFSGTASRSVLNIGSGGQNLTGTFGGGGTVTIDSGGTLTTSGTAGISQTNTFGNLDVTSGTLSLNNVVVSFAGTTSVTGSIVSAVTATGLKTFTGMVTVNSGGSFDLSATSPTNRFDGGITVSSGATIFYTGTNTTVLGGTQTFAGSEPILFGGTVAINSGAVITNSNTNTVTFNSSVTIASATADNGMSLDTGSTTVISGALSYTANAGTSDQTITMNGTANISANSVQINRPTNTGNANILCASGGSGTFTSASTSSFQGPTSASGATVVAINSCNYVSTGLLTIAGGSSGAGSTVTTTTGTLTANAGVSFVGTRSLNVLNIGGIFNITGSIANNGTVNVSGGTLVSTGTSSINDAYTFNNLSVPSGTLSLGGAITFNGSTSISGSLVESSLGANTFTGSVTVNSGGVFDITFNSPTTFSGGIIMNGTTFNAGTGAISFTVDQSLAGSADMSFGGTVTITNTKTLTNNNTGTVTFSGILSGGASGVFATGANSTTKFSALSAILIPSTSSNTIEYNGGTLAIVDATTNPYYNLTISGTGTKTPSTAPLIVTGVLTLMSTFDLYNGSALPLTANDIVIGATGTLLGDAATITVTNDWTNSGTFTPATSTVVFNGPSTALISGPTTFYNLTITHTAAKEVNFQTSGSPVFDITNLFTVTGSSGNLIKLYSDSAGTQWHFHPTGTASVDFVDVKDGGCESGSILISPTNFTDSGNNGSCWFAASLSFTFDISDATLGFGTLSSGATRYATGDTLGSASEVQAHTLAVSTTAPSGYTLSVLGGSLKNGAATIAAIGGTNTAPSVGTSQFGMRLTASGSNGVVSAPYAASGFAFAATPSSPSVIATAPSGDGATTTYSARYMCNISSTTAAGQYSTDLTYVLTGNF